MRLHGACSLLLLATLLVGAAPALDARPAPFARVTGAAPAAGDLSVDTPSAAATGGQTPSASEIAAPFETPLASGTANPVPSVAAGTGGLASRAISRATSTAPATGTSPVSVTHPVLRVPPQGYVYAWGTHLYLDGQPFRLMGANIYNANAENNCSYTMGSGSTLDQSLTDLGSGTRVIRAWFYQHLVDGTGSYDWTPFDHTLAVAHAHNVKVIATLSDQWGSCDTTPAAYKNLAWYQGGYRTAVLPGWIATYRDYVRAVVARYASNKTIAMWQLMNEAEDEPDQGVACDEAPATAALRSFADDVGGLVKSVDRNHLVSLGTGGGGQCGTIYTDYQSVYSSPAIDLCEFHDYWGPAPMPGDRWNGLAMRLQQCGTLDKPLFVGETGLIPDQLSTPTLQGRADTFQSKFQAQVQAGVVGEIVWAWMITGSTLNNYDIGAGDPTIAVLGRF